MFRQFLCPSSGVFHCTRSNGICHTGLLTMIVFRMLLRIDGDYYFTEVNGYVISAVISTISLVRLPVLLKTRGASFTG